MTTHGGSTYSASSTLRGELDDTILLLHSRQPMLPDRLYHRADAAMIYLVVQEAVYRHKIMGAYDSLFHARTCIEEYLEEDAKTDAYTYDADGHHDYRIYTIEEGHVITGDSDVDLLGDYTKPWSPDKKLPYTWVARA